MSNPTREALAARKRLKQERRLLGSVSTKLLEKVFGGTENPLVAITHLSPGIQSDSGYHMPRSMGFVTEILPGGYRLVCSCKHANVHVNEGYRSVLAMSAPSPRTWSFPYEDTGAYESRCADGWIPCREFNMISRPGNSGSPIWDARLQLYGINIRGNDPSMESYKTQGDLLGCVPTSRLFEARGRIEETLQRVLRQL